jgi:uncharacterized protein with NAD-binding domain and iron-sulfur cluster
MGKKVVIVGGGIAGLTAAHELIERGFEVHIYERRTELGGKAASRFVRSKATNRNGKHHCEPAKTQDGERGLPVEHGFRFFPSWYRHIIDTMARIPYQRSGELYQGATVSDNLVEASQTLVLWQSRPPVSLPTRLPNSASQFEAAGLFLREFFSLGITPEETLDFFSKLAQVSLANDEQHRALQEIRWWDFIEADRKSKAFQDLLRGLSETLIAARVDKINADTMSKLATRTLFDITASLDRVLNGPTQERFIDPWCTYLDAKGVEFHCGYELDSIVFQETSKDIGELRFSRVTSGQARRLRGRVAALECSITDLLSIASHLDINRPEYQVARLRRVEERVREALEAIERLVITIADVDPDRAIRDGITELCAQARSLVVPGKRLDLCTVRDLASVAFRAWDGLTSSAAAPAGWAALHGAFKGIDDQLRGLEFERAKRVEIESGDHVILSLPVEQMAYHVNRSATLRARAPELQGIVSLTDCTSWMAGIQFYLNERFDLVKGHGDCIDSPWGLTFVEQLQFWRDVHGLNSDVKAVLSVDIAEWARRGNFVPKEAYNCNDDEIATEVWEQLKVAINDSARQPRLRDDMLRSLPGVANPGNKHVLIRGINYNLDESIADIYDRKKQAFYERARGVALSREEPQLEADAGEPSYVWGSRLRYNVDPLLINSVGTHRLRPEARTNIGNLFLAADYVKTTTDLACMEGANEAARRAVNALLDVTGSHEARCQLWQFDGASQLTRLLGDMRQVPLSAGIATRSTHGALQTASAALGLVARSASQLFGNHVGKR